MSKHTIALISVLKPVDDTRFLDKMAKSLTKNGDCDIHLYGYSSTQLPPADVSIYFHPHTAFSPRSFKRLMVGLQIFKKLIRLKPQIIICGTHELLMVSVLMKWFFQCQIIYDIQENYLFNLIFQNNYPRWVSYPIGFLIRLKEIVLTTLFDHVILAENTYLNEMSFLGDNVTVIENKALEEIYRHDTNEIRLCFTGTLTSSNGIYRCLEFMKKLHDVQPIYKFEITGHCPNEHVWNHIHSEQFQFIDLNISRHPVPHADIIKTIARSTHGIVCYLQNPSNRGCMPTKVYEYCAAKLPLIYEKGAAWSDFISKHQSGIAIDFDNVNTKLVSDFITIKSHNFNLSMAIWSKEASDMQSIIDNLLNKKRLSR